MKFIVLISSLALSVTSFTVPTAFSPRVSSPPATTGLTRTTKLFGEYGASSTSFYTTTEKQDSYDDLDSILDAHCADKQLQTVIREMLDACADITEVRG